MSVVEPSASEDVPEVEDGLYTAFIRHVEGKTLDAPDAFGQTEKLIISIEIPDADVTLHPWVNRKWNQRANLFKIAQAAGLDPDPLHPFDTQELVGKRVRVMVQTLEEGRWPRVTQWSRVKTRKVSQPADEEEDEVPFSEVGAPR